MTDTTPTTPRKSASGYDLGPLPPAEIERLAARLDPEERRVLLDHGTERAVLRRPARQPRRRHLPVPAVRIAAVPLEQQVRFGHGLAELLPAGRSRARARDPRRELRHGAHRNPLRALRQPPRPRLPGRPAADRKPLLHELRRARVRRRPGRGISKNHARPRIAALRQNLAAARSEIHMRPAPRM